MNNDAQKQLDKNLALSKMPKNKARIEIAKDVIAALKLQKLKAQVGEYCWLDGELKNGSLREQLPDISCSVCAIGACFVALVARENKFDVGIDDSAIYDSDIYDRSELKKYFSNSQLVLMELAFEGDVYTYLNADISDNKYDKALNFYERYNDAHSRLIGIMKNIIKNDGEFVL